MNQIGDARKQLEWLKETCPLIGKCAEYDDLKVAIQNHKAK